MMKKICFCLFLFTVICFISEFADIKSQAWATVREPAVAGRFYSNDPAKLKNAVDAFLEEAKTPSGNAPVAIVSPHAGYIYSGQICADAFKEAAGHEYDLVVVLGTNHTEAGFTGVSIYPEGGYETPMGIVSIDEAVAKKLTEMDNDFTYNPAVHVREHSVEIQLPFIQRLFPNVKIVTAVVGSTTAAEKLGWALAGLLKAEKRHPLIVASTDLSHYPSYADAVDVDSKTVEAIASMNPDTFKAVVDRQMKRKISNLSTCACGEAPVIAAMIAARRLGANCGRVVRYANSGNALIGTRSRVVGYAAIAFTKAEDCSIEKPVESSSNTNGLNDDHKKTLLAFARKTIRRYFSSETTPLPLGFDKPLNNLQGAFVTLKKEGQLRGCIGHMAENTPLCQVVGAMALQAAFNDRRFKPLKPIELNHIEIEISVLTPSKEVKDYNEIVVGRDGVILKKDYHSAVYLPQVATEQGWNRSEMLDNLSQKAGLPKDAWKSDATFYTFQAVVFSESEMK